MDGKETAMKHHETSSGFPIRDQQVPGAKSSVHAEGPIGEPSLLQLSVSPLPSGVYPNLSRMKLHAFASTFEDVAWCLQKWVSWDYHSYHSISRVLKMKTC